ncbi:tetratricopeptide repeat protein [Terrirubrum flagellatum]|uniref:tetratricopeptide repeat protein n=1 Tax=Terrirubrum flagellatum TaxID=2895980 RepID=UPI003CC839F3
MEIARRKLDRNHPEFARLLNNLARTLRGMARYGEAEPVVREAITIWARSLHPRHANLARARHNLAYILLGLNRGDGALAEVQQALSVHREVLGADHFWTRDSARTCARLTPSAAQKKQRPCEPYSISRPNLYRSAEMSDLRSAARSKRP